MMRNSQHCSFKNCRYALAFVVLCAVCVVASCKKDKVPRGTPAPVGLYADSILFINNTSKNIVKSIETRAGTFTSFPDGLKIDGGTGAIDVNSSETGLKFRVTFTPANGTAAKTAFVIVSGINYKDKIYNLAAGDTVARPIYNADARNSIPQLNGGSTFDDDDGCKNEGIEVDQANATINLARSVRDQHEKHLDTGATQEVKLKYKINDKSNQAANELSVKIYFYRTVNEIPQYLTDLLKERQTTILSENPSILFPLTRASIKGFSAFTRAAAAPSRPRPPCIIVVSQ